MIFRILRGITGAPLNQGHRLRAIGRFVSWQIGSRLVPGPVIIPFVDNTTLVACPGLTAATGNLYMGLFEYEEMAFVLHALRSSDLFVDVGANIGSYTVLAGGRVGARCISFEPQPRTFEYLCLNTRINSIKAYVHNIAVGGENGVVKFSDVESATSHVVTGRNEASRSVDVPVRTLDDALEGSEPTVLKVDVEGYETEVIRGATRTLDSRSLMAVIMEKNGHGARYGFDEEQLHAKVVGLGLRPYTYEPRNRRLHEFHNVTGSRGNIIYVRDIDRVRRRLETAPTFYVHGTKV